MKKKRAQSAAPRCPYCGNHSVLRSADGIYRTNDKNTMLYVCSRYPACDSYVRAHPGRKIPLGTMANRELRALRNEAHRNFDQLHKRGLMSKEDAYHWLASILAAPLGQAHIGFLGEYYCRQVIDESQKVLNLQRNKNRRIVPGTDSFGEKCSNCFQFYFHNHVRSKNLLIPKKLHFFKNLKSVTAQGLFCLGFYCGKECSHIDCVCT